MKDQQGTTGSTYGTGTHGSSCCSVRSQQSWLDIHHPEPGPGPGKRRHKATNDLNKRSSAHDAAAAAPHIMREKKGVVAEQCRPGAADRFDSTPCQDEELADLSSLPTSPTSRAQRQRGVCCVQVDRCHAMPWQAQLCMYGVAVSVLAAGCRESRPLPPSLLPSGQTASGYRGHSFIHSCSINSREIVSCVRARARLESRLSIRFPP